MKNKKLIIFALLFSLGLSSCGEKKNDVSIFLYSGKDTFIGSIKNLLIDSFKNEFNYEIYDGQLSQAIQNKQIVGSIEDNNSLLVVNLVDRIASFSIIEKAQNKNIPLIFMNREPLEKYMSNTKNVYYIGTDPEEEGKLQAEIANDLFLGSSSFKEESSIYDKNHDGKLQVVLIKGEQGHQDTEKRSEYCISQLNSLGYEVDLIATSFCNWSKDLAQTEFERIYTDSLNEEGLSSIELVLSNNDDMAIGCSEYLKTLENYDNEKTIQGQYFPIIGVDATSVGMESIEDGTIYGTIKNNALKQAEAIFNVGRNLIYKKSLDDLPYTFNSNHYLRIKGTKIVKTNN